MADYDIASSEIERVGAYLKEIAGLEGATLGAIGDKQDAMRAEIRAQGGNPFAKATLFGQVAIAEGHVTPDQLSDALEAQARDRLQAAQQDIQAMINGEIAPEALNEALPGYIGGKFRMDDFGAENALDDAAVAIGAVARDMVRVAAQNPEQAGHIIQNLALLEQALDSNGHMIGRQQALEALQNLQALDLSVVVAGRDGDPVSIGNDRIDAFLQTAAQVVNSGNLNHDNLLQRSGNAVEEAASALADRISGLVESEGPQGMAPAPDTVWKQSGIDR